MADMNIMLVISANNQASGPLKQVTNDAGQMGNKLQGAVGPALAGAAAAGIALAGKYVADFVASSLDEFAQFETGMAEVFTVLPPLSDEAMGELESRALDAAASMGRLPEEVIPALYQALSAGIPPDNVFEFLNQANEAAIGGVTSLETAVDAISSVVNAYGDEIISAGEASDQMFVAAALGKTTFEEMGASLFQVVPTAASLQVEFSNVAAALAVMTAQGVPTSVATTQIRQALVELSKEGTVASDTFERVAGQSFTQFIAQGGDLQEALALMADEAQRTGVPVSNLFSSVEAGSAALTLTGDNARAFSDAITKMEESTGATGDAAAQFNDTIARTEDTIAAQTSQLKILIAEGLEPTKRAWLDLKQILVEAALGAAKEAQSRRERAAALEEEEQAQRDVKAELEAYIAANEVAIQTSRGFVDEQEAIWEAIDTVNAAFDPYNGSLHDAEMNANALEATLQLLEEGFSGTGAELGAAAISIAEYNDAIETMESQTSTASLALTDQGRAQAWMTENTEAARQAIIDSGPPLDGWMAGLQGAQVAAEDLAVTEEQLAAHQQLLNQYWGQSAGLFDPLIQAYGDLEEAEGEWVQSTIDNSGVVTDVNTQLAADLTEEQAKAWEETLTTVEEGSAEWLAAYTALQGDLTDAQRQELIARRADLESAQGGLVSVYTGDAEAAEDARGRITEANAAISESYRQMAADAILAEQGVNETTLAMLVDLGLLTPEAAALRWEFTQNSDIILNQLVPAFNAGKISSEELETAIALLEEGQANTAESAIAMAQSLNSDMSPAFREAKEEAIALETPIRNIKSAAEDAAGDYGINFNVTQNGEVPATPGYQGLSGAGYQGPPDGYALGGYTGDGPQSEIAGVVHRGEYVLPPDVVDRYGVAGIEDMFFGDGGSNLRGGSGAAARVTSGNNISITIPIYGNVDSNVYGRMKEEIEAIVNDALQERDIRASTTSRMGSRY